ncbi:MAG: MMPL family transporter [Candidatus Omnitrophica bacterium]|nr:MMPL family transporter [Candidatus Omnitrophota bacterium]
MRIFAVKFANTVVKYRSLFIFLFIGISLFFLYTIRDINFQTNIDDFYPQRHPYVNVQNKLTEIFGGLNQVSIAIAVEEGDILNPDTLGKVIRITNELYLLDGINAGRISSLSARKIKFIRATDDGFFVERVLRDVPKNDLEMMSLRDKIVLSPNVHIRMVSPDFKSTLIQADFQSGVSSRQIFSKLKEIQQREIDQNTKIHIAGRPVLEGYLDLSLPKMLKILLLTLLVVSFILYLTFRSKRGVILPLVDSAMATLWGLGTMKLIGFRLDPTTILVPFLILSLGISHSIHFMKHYYEEMKDRNKTSPDAVRRTLEMLFVPGLTAVITDGFGFLSLILIPLGTIRSMALAAGFGIFSNFLTSFIFTPCLISFMKHPKILEVRREERHIIVDRLLGKLVNLSTHKKTRFILIGIFVVVALVALSGINRIVVGDNSFGSSHLYPRSEYNQSEKFINENFGGTNSYYILVDGEEEDSLIDSQALNKIDSLQRYLLKNVDQAGYAVSITDYIKGLNFAMFSGDRNYFVIPENNRTIAEYLFLYEISTFPGDFEPVITSDYSKANIKVDLKDHQSTTIADVLGKTKQWIKNNITGKEGLKFMFAGGDIGMLAAINEIISRSIVPNILFISMLIFGYIYFIFGSLSAGFLLLVPLLFSVMIVFGIFGLTGMSLTCETLPLAALSEGLGVNYGIYVLTRLYQEVKRRSHPSYKEALRATLITSGKAVFFSGMIVSIGIFVWLFSDIRLQARLGLALGLTLIINMVASLVLLPVLISIFKPKFIFDRSNFKQ